MAQNADGAQKGSRSAVGPDRGLSNASSASKTGNGRAGQPKRDVPSHDKGGKNVTAGSDARNASNVMSQDHSAKSTAEDPRGQQSGRKRRRSRSRRKKGNNPAQPGAQTHTSNPAEQSNSSGPSMDMGDRTRASSGQSAHKSDNADRTHQSNGKENHKRRQKRQPREHSDGHRKQDGNASSADQQAKDGRDPSRNKERDQRQQHSGQQQSNRHRSDHRRSGGQYRHPANNCDSSRQAYAALDLGTNNCRLLVAEPHGQSFRVVDAFSRIVRLGEGLSQTGRLSEDAQDRAISALKVCQSKLNYRSVKRFRLIATEACRRATNGASFLNRVYRETGLKLEIVNRETEARLAVSGCASLVHPEADGVVLFDIGGGSSEIVWLDLDPITDESQPLPGEKRNRQTRRALRHMSERIRCWTSLQVGVVTLSEKHGGHIVDREQFETMVNEVREMLHDFEEREALAEAIGSKHIHMLGTSGTVTTLAGVHLGLERYDRRLVDGAWLSATELRAMIARILEMDFEERTNNPCIGHDRADLVLAGCAILEAFHREWPCARLRVADRGLREGILMEMMIDDGVWNPRQSNNQTKKSGSKKRRSRRRGGRGQRGGQNGKPQQATGAVE